MQTFTLCAWRHKMLISKLTSFYQGVFLYCLWILSAESLTPKDCQLHDARTVMALVNKTMHDKGLIFKSRQAPTTAALTNHSAFVWPVFESLSLRHTSSSSLQPLCKSRLQISVDLHRQPPVIFNKRCVQSEPENFYQTNDLKCEVVLLRRPVERLICLPCEVGTWQKQFVLVESGCQPMKLRAHQDVEV